MTDQGSGRPARERMSNGHEESGDWPCTPDSLDETPQGRPIQIRVIEIRGRGTCPLGLSVGDLFRSDRQVGAVCHWAGYTLLPWTTALRFGGDVPWEVELGLARVCCPDPDNVVVFEVRRRSAESPMPPGAWPSSGDARADV